MLIDEALRDVETVESTRSAVDVTGIQYDSRQVCPGDVFIAMRGETTDGNRYIGAAIDRGARAIITDSREVWDRRTEYSQVPFYLVAKGRPVLAGVLPRIYLGIRSARSH